MGIAKKYKRIIEFLYYVHPAPNSIHFLQIIQITALYVLFLLSLSFGAINIFLNIGYRDYFQVGGLVLFIGLLGTGMLRFWMSRTISNAQQWFSLAFFILLSQTFYNGGGYHGFAYFYFFAGFSCLYLIVGIKASVILAVYFLIGTLTRILLGNFNPESLYANPAFAFRSMAAIFIGVCLGITVNVSLEVLTRRLALLAFNDMVTKLPNRKKMQEFILDAILEAVKNNSGFALIGIKLLNFGKLNTNLGTQAADEILEETGRRLKLAMDKGAIASRWSGSILMAIIPAKNQADVARQAHEIKAALSQPCQSGSSTVHILHHIGACRYPEDAGSQEGLVANLLSLLGREGGGPGEIRYFNEEILRSERRRFSLMGAMNRTNPDIDFHLVYQPKVRLADGCCIGAEALIRWKSSELGEISPAEFIPVAEESGYVKSISRWVIRRVLKDLAAMNAQGSAQDFQEEFVIAVNLSVLDLKDKEFLNFVEQSLLQYATPAKGIELELTERLFVDDDPQIQACLKRLHKLGFRIAIDDFGTGYSSLSYLHQMRIHDLKIDQSFIRGIDASQADAHYPIVDAIISMGASLGVEVTAEGVETREQAEYLRARGCATAQGWYYCKGLPLDEFLEYLHRNQTVQTTYKG